MLELPTGDGFRRCGVIPDLPDTQEIHTRVNWGNLLETQLDQASGEGTS